VSDDASTDETQQVMLRYADHPRVHYHRHEKNLGIALNSTWVVSRPRTEFVVRLDSDDLLAPDYVKTLTSELRRYPQAGYAHAAVREIDQFGNHRRDRFLARKDGYQTAEDSLRALVAGYKVAANICMFRRAALMEAGYYRMGLNFGEDWDLAVRMADGGWGNVYSSSQLSSYRVWTDAGNVRPRRKVDEVEGYRRTLAESLESAFRRRGWSTRPIIVRRQALAAVHASAMALPMFNAAEKAALAQALCELGDGPALQWRLMLIRLGAGRALTIKDAALSRARDMIKRLLWLRPFA
jgi:glycosyltransferase involved in cell wall biosynthesis